MAHRFYRAAFCVLLTSVQLTAHSAGFGLSEQSGSGLGNAFAGASAVAEDASTIYYNPASMTYLEGTQIVGALYAINTVGHFHNAQSQAAAGRPLGDNGGNLGDLAFLPNIYYKQDLSDTVKFGIGISSPFGLKTEYDDAWIGRFQALKSDLKTVNINPSLAWKINDQWSVGFGVSAMWAQATLTSAVNLGAGGESSVKNKGDDWGFGFNLGTIYQMTEDTRIGIAYRSKVSQHLKGTANSAVTALNAIPTRTLNTDIQADITLPESLSFSTFSKMNDRWDLLTDITWTRWSRFKELNILRENGTGSILGSTIEHWNNTLRYSAALNYHYTEIIKLRSGMAYDQEAIDNTYRTARIPGNDRIWLSFGASWQWSPRTKLDAGYAHLFIKDANINDNQSALNRGVINGKFAGHADILSMQLSHQF